MTTFDAIYRDGALHPTVPLKLVDGTAVRVTVMPATSPFSLKQRDPDAVLARLKRIADMPDEASASTPSTAPDAADVLARILASAAKVRIIGDNPAVTSQNVDAILYGGPGGAR